MRTFMLFAGVFAIYCVAYQPPDQTNTAQSTCVTAFAVACVFGAAFGKGSS